MLPQPDGGSVFLVKADHVRQQPGGTVHPNHQQAGGKGIEGSGVADLSSTKRFARLGYDIVGRDTDAFINECDATFHLASLTVPGLGERRRHG